MTHVATLGTSSCATIAIGGFKGNNMADNEVYLQNPSSFKEGTSGLSVQDFSNNVLLPTSQNLGRSRDYPFEALMVAIDKSALKTKLVMATLNASQYMGNGQYWHKQLKKHGFKMIEKTQNSWGSVNYMYMRNPSRVAMTKEEEESA